MVPPETRLRWVRFLLRRDRARKIEDALAGRIATLSDIEDFVLTHPVRLNAPLVLISQVHRSGGTLLSQLFDGHATVAAHPHELKIGHPTYEDWPSHDPAPGPEKIFQMMFEAYTIGMVRSGFIKGRQESTRHPFFIVPQLQHKLFRRLWDTWSPANRRDVLDHFFTAYFNAWLNYQGSLEQKRWISAFAPRLADHEASVASFFECYPDGRLVQIVRDPWNWLPSAKHHDEKASTQPPEILLEPWCRSGESIIRNKAQFGDKVIVLRFEDLVGRTEATMHQLGEILGIEYNSSLCVPTFNSHPMKANSSFAVGGSGIIDEPLARRKMLSAEEEEAIEKLCEPLYKKVVAEACAVDA